MYLKSGIAAGSLRQLDPKVTAKRDLDTFMYYVPEYQKLGVTTQAEALDRMRELGFKVNPHNRVVHNRQEIEDYINEYTAKRDQLAYGIDGIVEKVNDLETEEVLGNTFLRFHQLSDRFHQQRKFHRH